MVLSFLGISLIKKYIWDWTPVYIHKNSKKWYIKLELRFQRVKPSNLQGNKQSKFLFNINQV